MVGFVVAGGEYVCLAMLENVTKHAQKVVKEVEPRHFYLEWGWCFLELFSRITVRVWRVMAVWWVRTHLQLQRTRRAEQFRLLAEWRKLCENNGSLRHVQNDRSGLQLLLRLRCLRKQPFLGSEAKFQVNWLIPNTLIFQEKNWSGLEQQYFGMLSL